MNLTRNFDAGECKLILDNEHNGTKDSNDNKKLKKNNCLLYTSPSPRDLSTSRMPSSA